MRKSSLITLHILVASLFLLISSSSGNDTIRRIEGLKDGQTLVSSRKRYVLGFFSPGASSARYLGIWFAFNSTTVVWVANRDNPLKDSSGVLGFDGSGDLVLTDKNNSRVWFAGYKGSSNAIAQLQDSGNFVLRRENSPETEDFLWQSFDYPTDTMLPGMKIGPDFKNNRYRYLAAWRNETDPSTGQLFYKLDSRGKGQAYVENNDNVTIYRSGPWNGREFSGNIRMRSSNELNFTVVHNAYESYYQYWVTNESIFARLVVEPAGRLTRYRWGEGATHWQELWSLPDDNVCDRYARCGPNGVCNSGSSDQCLCLDGFRPRKPDEWDKQTWTAGCVRKTNLSCGDGDVFLQKNKTKLPDMQNSVVNRTMDFDQCRDACSANCYCVAYAPANIRDGNSGCILWVGNLTDLRNFTDGGQDLYLRLARADLDELPGNSSKKKSDVIITTTLAAALALLLLALGGYLLWRRRIRAAKITTEGTSHQSTTASIPEEDNDLRLFGLETISLATDHFGYRNKIGKGGFGDVYKGQLPDGQLVAVKRISSKSGEGIAEFTTEVKLIAKLQHRNLVRLLGCCTQEGERLLVYEYMRNGSLDFFIFGEKEKRFLLHWGMRMDIIIGIARGLLYLHQDSRLRVIHRDLKAANVLLDEAMNPKISDFGTARIIGREQMVHKTMKIVGTIGYMSPEYVMGGKFSEKSDVFSFGVLVLEIISGKRNQWVSAKDPCMELLANAWRLCADNQCEKLLDSSLGPPRELSDIVRFTQVGLLCVQESPNDRPTMQQVVLMLVNKHSVLPTPKKPGFFNPGNLTEATHFFSQMLGSSSSPNASVTDFEGR